jgi:RES domain
VAAAIAASRLIAWQGRAWREHGRGYPAADPGGSRKYSGRYHQAQDLFPPDEVWAALYLALGRDIALGEMVRHTSGARLNELRFTEFRVELEAVLDGRDATILGLVPEDLWHDTDFSIPRGLAAAAIAHGAEGMLVPSATRLGNNLILFPDRLRPTHRLIELGHVDPELRIPRP